MSTIRRRPCAILTVFLCCCISYSNGLLSSSKTIANVRKSQHSFTSLHSQFSSDQEKANERRNGALVLLTVPVAWGSFEPATRFLYATAPELPSLLFSVAYYFVAAVTLLSFTLLTRTSQYTDDKTMQWPVWGGLELGLYLFVGNLLQVLGLRTVPSDRAAFLLQLTTVIVPLLEACRSKQVSSRTWCACLVALLGVGVMGLDSNDSASLASPVRVSNGDIMIGAAAVAYSFHCIRLEKYAQKTSAIQLAASKAVTETMCSFLAILTVLWYASSTSTTLGGSSGGLGLLSTFAVDSGNEIATYVSNHPFMTSQIDFSVIAAICWTGWVTVAYTIYAQSYGQSRVQPTTANLIYTIQPICTSLIAWFLLGESLGPLGWLGGSLIGVAVLLVAMPSGAASTNPDT